LKVNDEIEEIDTLEIIDEVVVEVVEIEESYYFSIQLLNELLLYQQH